MSKTSSEVKNRWNKSNYDDIRLVVKKGCKEELKQLAESENKSLNRFILDCISIYTKKQF